MTDQEKLSRIKAICEEAFVQNKDERRDKAIMHKAQALCDIYSLFLYDGATIPQIEEKEQISIYDLTKEI